MILPTPQLYYGIKNVVKLFEEEGLILIEGSVPGSKNGVVFIRDAIKYKTPDNAPFPAGLANENKTNNEDISLSNIDNNKETSSELEGGEVEN